MTLRVYIFPKLQTAKDVDRQMSKSPFSEHPSAVTKTKDPKHL